MTATRGNGNRTTCAPPLANVARASNALHGENTHDVPITRAEEMFTALRRREPSTAWTRPERTLTWFDRYSR